MSMEVERKFLVKNNDWRQLKSKTSIIQQWYLETGPKIITRVRERDGCFTMTFKKRVSDISRLEVEFTIESGLAAELIEGFPLLTIIRKKRHVIKWGDTHCIEVDEFFSPNPGMILAEVEFDREGEPFLRPQWFGEEVTGIPEYYNHNL